MCVLDLIKVLKVEKDNVIGFEGAAESVVKLLVEGAEHLQVVSIVGMIGLGKTTLAEKVYQDPNVEYEFTIRAFVHVSQGYEKRDVLLSILNSFSNPNEHEVKTEEQLETHLYKELEGKQYLIVLDDVWEKEDWDRLKGAFPDNEKRCRVLMATRNAQVAEHANQDPGGSLYGLDFLPLEASRKLLRWRVFRRDELDEGQAELERYEIEIAAKCGGVPLAIVVIAGILLNHPNRVDWWNDVANSVRDYLARDEKQTTTVIEMMYKHLPNYLKPCFLYLGVFPANSEISVWKLVRLWVAEGFILQKRDIDLEESAEIYLEELVQRNLVMVVKMRKNERTKTCRVQGTISEFCKKKAAKERIFKEIKKHELHRFSADNPALDTHRRLCNNNPNILEYISGDLRGKCVRSFFSYMKENTCVEAKFVSYTPKAFKAFKLLRVLEVQSLIFLRFPPDFCNLVLLKYIAISSTFSTLPKPMTSLCNLQTLIVITTSPTLDIRISLWKLPRFRHLHTNVSATLPTFDTTRSQKNQFTNSNIQTLSMISPESCTLEVLDWAPKVKKLGICGPFKVNSVSSFLPQLCRLESLENLKLLNDDWEEKMYSLPKVEDFPRRLTRLTLMNTRLEWKEMSTLGELGSLEILKLKEYSFQGRLWNTEKGGFQRLTHLFVGKTDLMVWEASKDHFPKLRSLELNGCVKLKAFPHDLADIPTLQLVVLRSTNLVVASSARRLQLLKLQESEKGNSSFKLLVYPDPNH